MSKKMKRRYERKEYSPHRYIELDAEKLRVTEKINLYNIKRISLCFSLLNYTISKINKI